LVKSSVVEIYNFNFPEQAENSKMIMSSVGLIFSTSNKWVESLFFKVIFDLKVLLGINLWKTWESLWILCGFVVISILVKFLSNDVPLKS